MDTEVKTPTAIIPAMDTKGLELALAELQQEALVLPELKAQADAMKVDTPQEYADAGALLLRVRSVRKVGAFKLGPFEEIVKRVAGFLKAERAKHESQVDAIDSILSDKMAAFKRREREAAAREAERENQRRRQEAQKRAEEDRKVREKEIEKQRKAGELSKREAEAKKKEAAQEAAAQAADVKEVTVDPNVPKMAGLKQRVNYKFEILNAAHVNRPWLVPDMVAIGQKVRADKDPDKSMREIGGIRVFTEDSV